MCKKLIILSFLILFFKYHLLQGKIFEGSITSALGGAGRAAIEETESPLLNPATLPHIKGYNVGFFLSDTAIKDIKDIKDNFKENTWGTVISDNSPGNLFPASLSYFKIKKESLDKNNSYQLNEDYWQLSTAIGITNKFSFGISYQYLKQELTNEDYTQHEGHIGLLYTPFKNIGLALVGYNLFSKEKDIPELIANYETWSIGLAYIVKQMFRMKFDASYQPKFPSEDRSIYMGGIESFFSRWFVFRIGYQKNNIYKYDKITYGLGFVGPKLKLEYSLEKFSKELTGERHCFNLRISLR